MTPVANRWTTSATVLLSLLLFQNLVSAAPLQVVQVVPPPNGTAGVFTSVRVTFDRPVLVSTINAANFRIYGKYSGRANGTITFADLGRTVVLTPANRFAAGEVVQISLSRNIQAQDLEPLRPQGYAAHFRTQVAPSSIQYQQIDVMSNRTMNAQTRIYGAAVSDLNEDGSLDLTTVNEVSADVRVFLNLDDGTGLYDDFLTPQPIGIEASPNDVADFNNDGHADLCTAAASSGSVWVLLGAGTGTYSSITEIAVGVEPHGNVALDVDGDADMDIVNANVGDNNLSLLINNGSGVFGSPTYFSGGVDGEYGLATADMNADGITDLVVGGVYGEEVRTLLGNGNGTFTPAAVQNAGGAVWVVTPGDLNGDGLIDITTANSFSENGAALLGNGDGTFDPPSLISIGAHTVSTDLGDLDGDSDLDWILSSFGGGFWRIYTNNGAGTFSFLQQINAPNNPSCSIILDFDNDLDLDLALTDEIADVVILMKNTTMTTGVPDLRPAPDLAVRPNVPNPFSGSTVLSFSLPEAGPVRLEVFDSRGSLVRQEELGERAAGWNETSFEGKDRHGRALANGAYFYRVVGASGSVTGRVILRR